MAHSQKRTPEEARRHIMTRISVTKSGCWEYQGYKSKLGYTNIAFNGRVYPGHRIMWILTNGDPGKLLVCHRCDNPTCINPDHMFLGTHKDNTMDSVKKKRHAEAARTHCYNGHEYKPWTVFTYQGHKRACKLCIYKRNLKRQGRTFIYTNEMEERWKSKWRELTGSEGK